MGYFFRDDVTCATFASKEIEITMNLRIWLSGSYQVFTWDNKIKVWLRKMTDEAWMWFWLSEQKNNQSNLFSHDFPCATSNLLTKHRQFSPNSVSTLKGSHGRWKVWETGPRHTNTATVVYLLAIGIIEFPRMYRWYLIWNMDATGQTIFEGPRWKYLELIYSPSRFNFCFLAHILEPPEALIPFDFWSSPEKRKRFDLPEF